MKISMYNYVVKDGLRHILYNTATERMLVMNTKVFDVFKTYKNKPENIKSIHPKLYDTLIADGFIVDDATDETLAVISRWEALNRSTTTYSITINPTLLCNMGCWYCYESKTAKGYMPAEIQERVKKLIMKIASDEKYKAINFSFFGGEPLLAFNTTIKGLVTFTQEQCKANGKNIGLHFTTNGYLLTKEMLEFLSAFNVSFQIPLDGNETVHNSIKITKDGKPTYQRTIENIKMAIDYGCSVGVRLNFTAETLPYFLDVLSDFKDLDDEKKKFINFNFQRVWQDNSKADAERNVSEREDFFSNLGFAVSPYTSNAFLHCIMDSPHSIAINYDGMVFKCTGRDFTEQNSDGVIAEDGTIQWNEHHTLRENARSGNAVCRKCNLYPLCHGGCGQFKMESDSNSAECPKGYNKQQKELMIYNRIKELLSHF
ncbi:MAG: radical SAM protein [Clostridium sp.]|nr:radical SAM protein [Clostridium sp.]